MSLASLRGRKQLAAAMGVMCLLRSHAVAAQESASTQFIDLSVMVAQDLPCTSPTTNIPFFLIQHYLQIGPFSPYNSDVLVMDFNTGTQLDVPTHSIPAPGSGLPDAGPFGLESTEKVPAWQFVGEACLIDVRSLLNSAPNGRGSLVTKELIMAWERAHRVLGPGDVALVYSGYSEAYYRPFPAGRRFIADPLDAKAPGWPDPDPDGMEYLASRNVMTAGTDSPTMGPLPDELAGATHTAGLRHGMIWTESATGFSHLPPTGAFYCMMGPKHDACPGSEARAFAILGGSLAPWLITAARKKNVVDLSVLLSDRYPVWWPGRSAGNHRDPYLRIPFWYDPRHGAYTQVTHMMDSSVGTHLVPPAYALPAEGFNNRNYAPEVRAWLAEFEKKYGPRGDSEQTGEKVPLSQTCGWMRRIDVKYLIGTTGKNAWPSSPEITTDDIKKYESQYGALKPGEIVVFYSGYSDDRCSQPMPTGAACMSDPLKGKSEGWPAPGPDAILYLAARGIKCVATDGPTLGGVDPRRALMTYWALGTKGMVAVEYLTNLGKLPERAYFLFAAPKIRDCHGGPGRALALF